MRSDVALQEPWPGKGLAAVRALAALTVRADVHGEGGHRDVHLVTMGTASGLLEAPMHIMTSMINTSINQCLHTFWSAGER